MSINTASLASARSRRSSSRRNLSIRVDCAMAKRARQQTREINFSSCAARCPFSPARPSRQENRKKSIEKNIRSSSILLFFFFFSPVTPITSTFSVRDRVSTENYVEKYISIYMRVCSRVSRVSRRVSERRIPPRNSISPTSTPPPSLHGGEPNVVVTNTYTYMYIYIYIIRYILFVSVTVSEM